MHKERNKCCIKGSLDRVPDKSNPIFYFLFSQGNFFLSLTNIILFIKKESNKIIVPREMLIERNRQTVFFNL